MSKPVNQLIADTPAETLNLALAALLFITLAECEAEDAEVEVTIRWGRRLLLHSVLDAVAHARDSLAGPGLTVIHTPPGAA